MTATRTNPLDGAVERLGRGLAARTTRRSFLDRMAKVAVLVAGGPSLATLLTGRAEARVCGQSGVTPTCPTFDCTGPGDVWGWCWYASPGCCSNGGLKKICDCCTVDYPNVHGYCPSGTNVRCIVESCHADPRVMTKPVHRAPGLTAAAVAAGRARLSGAGRGGRAVVVDADEPLLAAAAGPVAAILDAPVLVTARTRLSAPTVAALQRLGIEEAMVIGPAIGQVVLDDLGAYGVRATRLGGTGDAPAVALELARWVLDRTPVRRAFCVAATGESAAVAPAAGAVAAAKRAPLVVGVDAAKQLAAGDDPTVLTYLVGPEVAGRAGEVPGGVPLRAAGRRGLSLELATLAVATERLGPVTLNLVPESAPHLAAGLVTGGGVTILHPDGQLGPEAFGWVVNHHGSVRRAVLGGSLGTFGDQGVWELQSALHRFDTHYLQGVAGQGLPVISQPLPEREIGRARIAGVAPEPMGAYWASRANPNRR